MFITSKDIVGMRAPPVTRRTVFGGLGGQPLRVVATVVVRAADLGLRAIGALAAADAQTVREAVPTS
jgi:hypothetical protein